jgi:hypothetical protein
MKRIAHESKPCARGYQLSFGLRTVERDEDAAVGRDTLVDFNHVFVERSDEVDAADKQLRTMLVTDAQLVAEAARRNQHGARTFTFQEGVRRDGRSHMDFGDFRIRQGVVLRSPEQTPNSFDRGVVVMFGAFGEKFGRAQLPVRA